MCKVIDLRNYRRMKERIMIRDYRDYPAANKTTGLMIATIDNKPAVIIFAGGKEYAVIITSGFQIHFLNDFLKSLNLGLDIKFHNFNHYALLLYECDELLRERNKKNSIISM